MRLISTKDINIFLLAAFEVIHEQAPNIDHLKTKDLKNLLSLSLAPNKPLTAAELCTFCNIAHVANFNANFDHLIKRGYIKRAKKTLSKQRYIITDRVQTFIDSVCLNAPSRYNQLRQL